jgi:hypothetical protein
MHPSFPAALLLTALLACGQVARAADPVTVYRCTDAAGQVTLGDVPCAAGSSEQVRAMQRPQDRPLPSTRPPEAPQPTSPAPAPQVVVVRTPQPMYECTTPDGERYTSDDGEGNPRWVPLWTLGYRSGRGHPRPGAGGVNAGALGDYYADRPLGGRVGAPTPRPPAPSTGGGRPGRQVAPHRPGYGDFGGPGTWIRDTCHTLPQGEVCGRLADRRDEIRRRFFNAQETERDTLRREERGINARLAADCGNG